MKFTVRELDSFSVVHFELENAVKPELLKNLEVPKVNTRKGCGDLRQGTDLASLLFVP